MPHEYKHKKRYAPEQQAYFLEIRRCKVCNSGHKFIILAKTCAKLYCKKCNKFQDFVPKAALKIYINKHGTDIIDEKVSTVEVFDFIKL